jgi:DNA-directed RNA polymerase subunit N (RpoN/RPB10)
MKSKDLVIGVIADRIKKYITIDTELYTRACIREHEAEKCRKANKSYLHEDEPIYIVGLDFYSGKLGDLQFMDMQEDSLRYLGIEKYCCKAKVSEFRNLHDLAIELATQLFKWVVEKEKENAKV